MDLLSDIEERISLRISLSHDFKVNTFLLTPTSNTFPSYLSFCYHYYHYHYYECSLSRRYTVSKQRSQRYLMAKEWYT